MNVNSRKISILTLLALIGIGVFSFQNCAPPKTSSGFQSSTAGLSGQVSPSSFAESQTFSVGRCGSAVNTCDEGVFVNEPDSDVSVWKCVGTAGGSSIRCTTNFSSGPIAGVCSSVVNQCIQGQSVDTANTVANQEAWQCRGFNGGTTASCVQNISGTLPKIDGACGSQALQCAAGSLVQNVTPPAGSTDIFWVCNGTNGGAPSPVCRYNNADPMAPLCGSSDASCLNGSTVLEVDDTNVGFLWKCTKPGYNPVSCSVEKPNCIVSVEQRTHFGDTFTYRVETQAGATLPASVNIRYFGTKSALDGSGTVTDATGSDSNRITNVRTPISYPMTNPGGNAAGKYTRSFAIFKRLADGRDGKEQCRTNIVDQVLTPKCGLSFDKTSMNATETHVATFNFAADTQMPPTTASLIKWFGTKNNEVDERGQTSFNVSVADNKTAVKTMGPFAEGSYQRVFIAADNTGLEICKSASATFTVTSAPRVDGLCEDSSHPLAAETCAVGTPGGVGPSNDSATSYVWTCQGSGGGSSPTCTQLKPTAPPATPTPTPTPTPPTVSPPPVCGASAFTCDVGTVGDIQRNCEEGIKSWICTSGTQNSTCIVVTAPFCRVVTDPCGNTVNDGSATIQLQMTQPCL